MAGHSATSAFLLVFRFQPRAVSHRSALGASSGLGQFSSGCIRKQEQKLKPKNMMSVVALTLFAIVPTALASSAWYVDGVNGSDHHDCQSRQTACKTIGHAIALSARGDSIIVAAATYHENLTIPHGLNIVGAGAATTIIDGGGIGSVIFSAQRGVMVSQVTMRNGGGDFGGGVGDGGNIYNCFATLMIMDSIITGGRVQPGHGNDGYGGGIYNCPDSTMTIVNTTISDNSAEEGGGICNGGALTITNSTFSGNTRATVRAEASAITAP
jgi:hypothetical protein